MLDGGFLEPRVAALENKMSLMGSDLHAVQIAGAGVGGMIDSLSPATNKGQDFYGSGGETFNHRWKVTLSTSTDEGGTTTYTLHITPGSLWRDEGAGAVDLNVAPDGSTVTVSGAEWLAAGVTASGALYVVEDSPSATVPYPLVYGDPASETSRILLRVADLTVASSGVTLTQRQIGDALTGGASGLQPGPIIQEVINGVGTRFVQYMGKWTFREDLGRWDFVRAVKPDGTQYPQCSTYALQRVLIKNSDNVNVIATVNMPKFSNLVPDSWLYRTTVRVSQGIDVTPPETDTGTGSVAETMRDLVYFTDDATANKSVEWKLSIQVAEANDATAYDS